MSNCIIVVSFVNMFLLRIILIIDCSFSIKIDIIKYIGKNMTETTPCILKITKMESFVMYLFSEVIVSSQSALVWVNLYICNALFRVCVHITKI